MPDVRFRHFLAAFTATWFTKMSGPPTVPFTIDAVFVPQIWLKILLGLLALLCWVASGYAVWRNERMALLAEQSKNQRPQLVGGIIDVGVYDIEEENYPGEPIYSRRVQVKAWIRNESPVESCGRIGNVSLFNKQAESIFLRDFRSGGLALKLRERLAYGHRVEGLISLIVPTPLSDIDLKSATITVLDDFDRQIVLGF